MSVRFGAVSAVARYVLLLVLLTAPAWAPLTRPGLPENQAGPLPVLKLYAVERGEGTSLGQPLDRWRGEGPWPFAFARAWHILGASGVAAIKGSMGIALAVLALAVLGWAALLSGVRAGVLAALLAVLAPPFLGALYFTGDLAAVWVAAGLALAAWGLAIPGRWGWFAAAAGSLIALASLPGLGLWAAVTLLVLALGRRRWQGALAVVVGSVLGLLLTIPWSRPLLPASAGTGVQFYQLVEPGWAWVTDALGLASAGPALSFSLGLPLLGLLIAAIWALSGGRLRSSSPWLWPLALGLGLVFASLDGVAQHVALVPATVAAPWHLLLLALPLLAVTAASVLRFLPELRQAPLWAALLVLPLLGAAPFLSPDLEVYDVPFTAVATFGDQQVMLLRLEHEGTPAPGAGVTVHAEWMALKPLDFDYNIFLHAEDAAGATYGQVDTQPLGGERPMTTWKPGEIMTDTYQLVIPPDAPAGLHLTLGLYNWQTQERLQTSGGNALEVP